MFFQHSLRRIALGYIYPMTRRLTLRSAPLLVESPHAYLYSKCQLDFILSTLKPAISPAPLKLKESWSVLDGDCTRTWGLDTGRVISPEAWCFMWSPAGRSHACICFHTASERAFSACWLEPYQGWQRYMLFVCTLSLLKPQLSKPFLIVTLSLGCQWSGWLDCLMWPFPDSQEQYVGLIPCGFSTFFLTRPPDLAGGGAALQPHFFLSLRLTYS